MTKADVKKALLELPPQERLEVVEEVWQELDFTHDVPPLTEEQMDFILERRTEADENPDDVLSWEEVRAGIEAGL